MKKILSQLCVVMLSLVGLSLTSCGGKSADDYNTVGEFENGYAVASYNGANNLLRYVIVDEKFNPVIEEMRSIERYSDDFWVGENVNGKYVSIDRKLNITPLEFQSPEVYRQVSPKSIIAYDSDQSLVIVDLTTGKPLSKTYPECEIDQILDNGTIVLKHQTRKGYGNVLCKGYAMIDSKGNELVPLGKYTFIGDFHNGLATFSSNGYGIPISRTNCKYVQETIVNGNGRAKWFELGNCYGNFGKQESDQFTQGYLNEKGEEVIPQSFVYAQPFDDNGFAIVGGKARRNRYVHHEFYREYSKIDKTGKVVATKLKTKEQHGCIRVEIEP